MLKRLIILLAVSISGLAIVVRSGMGLGFHRIKGITVVAPPQPFKGDPFVDLQKLPCQWVAIVPYAYTPANKPQVKYNLEGWQWWGERREGILASIQMAHQAGLKIMLKPQIYVHGTWTGALDFKNDSLWELWEMAYATYISDMIKIAEEEHVEMFCVGTEFNRSTDTRPQFWIKLIDKIRHNYKGLLTYSDNWDHYRQITFWDKLDFIGISAYFPLIDIGLPLPQRLDSAWSGITDQLRNYSSAQKRQILFTEFGYMSCEGAAGKSWELEKILDDCNVNEQTQADCFDALFRSCWPEKFWAGGFVWKWYPEGMGHEGFPEKDYTPQHKKAEWIIQKWYRAD
ncbi:MAG: hypothetical protein K1X68_02870 [Saprospiraceae bacterium]|nr:hypothetical protein [Saprospiraceae bacterium]HMW38226.1 hypothetical protein [Saprospiraceae bacterium]HMX87421.1 hypothetical protein [Saprospiraceae bacterium]HMZ39248.1 hypothetical protein [Saprospiraceae bacterium]HNA65163.1 hypothetical protein [Saprospiraceae bacterium]